METQTNISKNLIPRIYFNGRKNLIRRYINNLIDNSIKYGDKIHIELIKNKNNLFIKIEDNGSGIPVEEYDNARLEFDAIWKAWYFCLTQKRYPRRVSQTAGSSPYLIARVDSNTKVSRRTGQIQIRPFIKQTAKIKSLSIREL